MITWINPLVQRETKTDSQIQIADEQTERVTWKTDEITGNLRKVEKPLRVNFLL